MQIDWGRASGMPFPDRFEDASLAFAGLVVAIVIAGGFALRTIKVARQADAHRALQEKVEGSR